MIRNSLRKGGCSAGVVVVPRTRPAIRASPSGRSHPGGIYDDGFAAGWIGDRIDDAMPPATLVDGEPVPGPSNSVLNGVSCLSATSCMAAGDDRNVNTSVYQTLVESDRRW